MASRLPPRNWLSGFQEQEKKAEHIIKQRIMDKKIRNSLIKFFFQKIVFFTMFNHFISLGLSCRSMLFFGELRFIPLFRGSSHTPSHVCRCQVFSTVSNGLFTICFLRCGCVFSAFSTAKSSLVSFDPNYP